MFKKNQEILKEPELITKKIVSQVKNKNKIIIYRQTYLQKSGMQINLKEILKIY